MWPARFRTLNALLSRSFINGAGQRCVEGSISQTLQLSCASAIACSSNRTPPTTRRLAAVVASAINTSLPGSEYHFLQRVNAMDVLWDIVVFVGHAIEQVFIYVETHH